MCDFFSKYIPKTEFRFLSVLSVTLFLAALQAGCGHVDGSAETDSVRLKRLSAVDDSVMKRSPRARSIVFSGMAGAKDSIGYYEYCLRVGKYYHTTSTPDSAEPYLNRTITFASNARPSARINSLLGDAYNTKAGGYHNFNKKTREQINLYVKAYGLIMKSDDQNRAPNVCANLADAYISDNNLPKAARWYRRALFLVDSLGMPSSESVTLYMGLAQIYTTMHDYDAALKYYRETSRHFNGMTPSMKAYFMNNYGNYFYFRKDYRSALKMFLRLKKMLESYGMKDNFDMYLCKVNLADVFLNIGQTDSATRYVDEVEPFFRKTGNPTAIYYCNTIRIGICVSEGNVTGVKRILASEKGTTGNVDLNMKNIRDTYLRKYYSMTGDYRQAYDNLLRNSAYNDSLEHNRSSMRTAEIMARFEQDTIMLHHELEMEHKEIVVQRSKMTTVAAVAIAVITVLVLMVWSVNVRKEHLKSRINIMNLKLAAVRNRITPHFVFNVLNNKIVNSDAKEASELLELTKLIRTNLDMSCMLSVPLNKELDFVDRYVAVERYLLGDGFVFEENVSAEIDTGSVQVPSMFVQLLVENAIKHGLKGKDGPKLLTVDILPAGNGLDIVVTDNGHGLSESSPYPHVKTGLKIISQTLAVLNERNKQKMRFNIANTVGNDGQVTGCKATLHIPRQYMTV